MSLRHKGVSCDACMKNGFKQRRYKCLVCYDYDLCGPCYDSSQETNNHSSSHPMQCLLTSADYNIFFAGEKSAVESPQSYTCPVCGKLGLSEAGFIDHVIKTHPATGGGSGDSEEAARRGEGVICPLCAGQNSAYPGQELLQLARHVAFRHRRSSFNPTEAEMEASLVNYQRSSSRPVPHSSNRTAPIMRLSTEVANQMAMREDLYPPATSLASARAGRRTFASVVSDRSDDADTSTGDPLTDLLSQLHLVRSRTSALSMANHQIAELDRLMQQEQDHSTSSSQQKPSSISSSRLLQPECRDPEGDGDGGDQHSKTTSARLKMAAVMKEKEESCSPQPGLMPSLVRQLQQAEEPLSNEEISKRSQFLQELILASIVLPPPDTFDSQS